MIVHSYKTRGLSREESRAGLSCPVECWEGWAGQGSQIAEAPPSKLCHPNKNMTLLL